MKVEIKIEITEQMFEDILITALEGGSNYWYLFNKDEFKNALPEKAGTYNTLSEKIAKALFNIPSFYINVYDIENEDEILGVISKENCQIAFNILAKDNPEVLARLTSEQYDAEDADIFFQYAVMGEIVFG